MRKHNRLPKGRYFFSQKQMREYRWLESLMYARAKREGRVVKRIHGTECGCGCGPFPIEIISESTLTPPLPAKPKKPTIRSKKSHPMFSGGVVS